MSPRRIIRPPHPTQPAIDAVMAAPVLKYHGDKKYARNVRAVFTSLPEVDLAAIGYARPEVKLNQLRRNYLNETEVARVSAILKNRNDKELTSVGMSFRGLPKTREGNQGWCIESAAILKTNGRCYVTVFYRQTEVITKFAADLVLLREVFTRLSIVPASIEFHFAAAWIGMQFLPALFTSTPPVPYLERLRGVDRTLWTSATWYLTRYVSGNPVGFGPADRQMRVLLRSMSDDRLETLREYLREHGRLAAVA